MADNRAGRETFACEKCKKEFNMKHHLKRHNSICKGIFEFKKCVNCGDSLKSERTLKAHKLSCKVNKKFYCYICNKSFPSFDDIWQHKQSSHSKIQCDFCEYTGLSKNLKRHMIAKHKGLTPSKSARLEKEYEQSQFKCEKCRKSYFDKSTLNRHKKTHGNKYFNATIEDENNLFEEGEMIMSKKLHDGTVKNSDRTNAKSNQMNHGYITLDDDKNISEDGKTPAENELLDETININEDKESNSSDTTNTHGDSQIREKQITWSSNLTNVKIMPISKVCLNEENVKNILELQKATDRYMCQLHNRGQIITLDNLKINIASVMKKTVDEQKLLAMFSVHDNMYSFYLDNKNVCITMKTSVQKVTPTVINDRTVQFRETLFNMKRKHSYIDLISFPEPKKNSYKSAKEIIQENILRFSFSDSESESDSGTLNYEQIRTKIQRKNEKKLKRQHRIDSIDWQYQRLSDLSRLINNIYISEKKKALRFNILVDRLVFIKEANHETITSDLHRLINSSNGWLTIINGWVKIHSEKYNTSLYKTTEST